MRGEDVGGGERGIICIHRRQNVYVLHCNYFFIVFFPQHFRELNKQNGNRTEQNRNGNFNSWACTNYC